MVRHLYPVRRTICYKGGVRSAALWILWNGMGCNCVIVLLVLRSPALPESFLYSCEWWQAAWLCHAAVCGNGCKSMVLVVSRLFWQFWPLARTPFFLTGGPKTQKINPTLPDWWKVWGLWCASALTWCRVLPGLHTVSHDAQFKLSLIATPSRPSPASAATPPPPPSWGTAFGITVPSGAT